MEDFMALENCLHALGEDWKMLPNATAIRFGQLHI